MTKNDCKAQIDACLRFDGKWQICSVFLNYNHELCSPAKTHYFKSNWIIQPYVKRKFEMNDRVGIRPNKNLNSFLAEAGGAKNLSFL